MSITQVYHTVLTNSSTTKVFEDSAIAASGLSLNNILLKGPKVLQDVVKILWRFRIHNIAKTPDVAKMNRQVLLAPDDCELQRILCRSNPVESLYHSGYQ